MSDESEQQVELGNSCVNTQSNWFQTGSSVVHSEEEIFSLREPEGRWSELSNGSTAQQLNGGSLFHFLANEKKQSIQ